MIREELHPKYNENRLPAGEKHLAVCIRDRYFNHLYVRFGHPGSTNFRPAKAATTTE